MAEGYGDEEIERLVIGVRADTGRFAEDVRVLRGTLESGLGEGAVRAGRAVEAALARAISTGKFGFDDLKRVALAVLADIGRAAVRDGLGGGGGGLGRVATAVLGGAFGLPGRATGGPVSPGAAYLVGERGPELFVPTASGRIERGGGGGPRDVRVAIRIDGAGEDRPQALGRSARQVARAVARAIRETEA
ncbi:MAG: tail tape measure protein [Sphingomonas fennica]